MAGTKKGRSSRNRSVSLNGRSRSSSSASRKRSASTGSITPRPSQSTNLRMTSSSASSRLAQRKAKRVAAKPTTSVDHRKSNPVNLSSKLNDNDGIADLGGIRISKRKRVKGDSNFSISAPGIQKLRKPANPSATPEKDGEGADSDGIKVSRRERVRGDSNFSISFPGIQKLRKPPAQTDANKEANSQQQAENQNPDGRLRITRRERGPDDKAFSISFPGIQKLRKPPEQSDANKEASSQQQAEKQNPDGRLRITRRERGPDEKAFSISFPGIQKLRKPPTQTDANKEVSSKQQAEKQTPGGRLRITRRERKDGDSNFSISFPGIKKLLKPKQSKEESTFTKATPNIQDRNSTIKIGAQRRTQPILEEEDRNAP